MDVNEIFRDLGAMIHEQGEMIGRWITLTLSRLYNVACHFLALEIELQVLFFDRQH